MKAKKEPPKYSNAFACCGADFGNPEAIKKHLQEVHGITEFKGTKSMQLHADHHVTSYEWTIKGVKFAQCVVCPRKGFDGRYLNPR